MRTPERYDSCAQCWNWHSTVVYMTHLSAEHSKWAGLARPQRLRVSATRKQSANRLAMANVFSNSANMQENRKNARIRTTHLKV